MAFDEKAYQKSYQAKWWRENKERLRRRRAKQHARWAAENASEVSRSNSEYHKRHANEIRQRKTRLQEIIRVHASKIYGQRVRECGLSILAASELENPGFVFELDGKRTFERLNDGLPEFARPVIVEAQTRRGWRVLRRESCDRAAD